MVVPNGGGSVTAAPAKGRQRGQQNETLSAKNIYFALKVLNYLSTI
jgi:hypothetical protein